MFLKLRRKLKYGPTRMGASARVAQARTGSKADVQQAACKLASLPSACVWRGPGIPVACWLGHEGERQT